MAETALAESIEQKRALIEAALKSRLPSADTEPRPVHQAMHYATLGPGKRLRPFLSLGVSELAGQSPESVIDAACAVEFVHTASLVLDDLPSMDNAQGRRGHPCTHQEFGEATALLAAMGLIALAFELLARNAEKAPAPSDGTAAVHVLAEAIGTRGIIAGQHVDLGLVEQSATLDELAEAYMQKAGALFLAAVVIPAHLLGMDTSQIKALTAFATHLGLAFQITDDLIDENHAGSHRERTSFTTHLGPDGARQKAEEEVQRALHALAPFGEKALMLRVIADHVAARTE